MLAVGIDGAERRVQISGGKVPREHQGRTDGATDDESVGVGWISKASSSNCSPTAVLFSRQPSNPDVEYPKACPILRENLSMARPSRRDHDSIIAPQQHLRCGRSPTP